MCVCVCMHVCVCVCGHAGALSKSKCLLSITWGLAVGRWSDVMLLFFLHSNLESNISFVVPTR